MSMYGSAALFNNFLPLPSLHRDYTQMNALADKYGEQLVILAFPCNQVTLALLGGRFPGCLA